MVMMTDLIPQKILHFLYNIFQNIQQNLVINSFFKFIFINHDNYHIDHQKNHLLVILIIILINLMIL